MASQRLRTWSLRSPVTASRAALLVGALLALTVSVLVAGLAWYERGEILEAEIGRGELLARVLEDHATRTVDTAAVSLTALAELIDRPGFQEDPSRFGATLSQALVGLPFMRSLALLDADGRVLASTEPQDVDAVLPKGALGPLPAAGQDVVLAPVAGRTLADVANLHQRGVPSVVSFIPLVRDVPVAGGRRHLLLVGLLNPDALANYQGLTLSEVGDIAVLALYDGQVLAASGDLPTGFSRLDGHLAMRELARDREHGSYIGSGLVAGSRLVAFRASTTRPLVVVMEQPLARVEALWLSRIRWLGLTSLLAIGFISIMSWLAWRSLRARESARRERDAAQFQAVQREQELSMIVKSVQELIFRTDTAGRITFVNARWALWSGQTPDQALGRQLRELVDVSQHSAVDTLFSLDGEAGMRTATLTVASPSGKELRFDVTAVPLRLAGRIAGFAGSAVDITERWTAQQRLQAQLALTALVLEVTPVPMSLTDANQRVVTVNQAWETFSGLPRELVIGRPRHQLLPCRLPDEVASQNERRLQGGDQVRFEALWPHEDGSVRDVVVSQVHVPDERGETLGVLCTVMDVSEFREAERATREARDTAEEASRAKSEFIANISHELRTPLQSILGFSELGMVRGREHERLAAMFKDIHGSGERMLALVNDLLDVSKIESTVGTFHLERTDLRSLVRGVGRELEPLLQGRQLRLEVDLSDAPLVAKVDPMRFQQVIRNVLANAIKFSPVGSAIEVHGQVVGNDVQLQVRDHGPGIPTTELEAIFEAFVQSSATKDGAGGTGLGLAICRKIVEGHGGSIRAANAEGGGALFEIRVAARGGAETAPMPMDDATPRSAPDVFLQRMVLK